MGDSYDRIRQLLPPSTKLGFVFPLDRTELVFYQDGFHLKQAQFEKDGLVMEQAHAMDDDGLGPKKSTRPHHWIKDAARKMVLTPDALLAEKFKPMTESDKYLWELFKGDPPRSDMHIAIGLEFVIARQGRSSSYNTFFGRTEWDFGDQVIRLLADFPPLVNVEGKGYTLIENNVQRLLTDLGDMIDEAPQLDPIRIILSAAFETFSRHLGPVEYHPKLAPLYANFKQKSAKFFLAEHL